LIRRGDLDLARHVLDVLDQDKTSSIRDITAYLRAWIEMETRAFPRAKSDLLARLQQQPGDAVALSLLQACIVSEIEHGASLAAEAKFSPAIDLASAPTSPSEPAAEPSAEPLAAIASLEASALDAEMASYQAVITDLQTWSFAIWDGQGASRLSVRKPDMSALTEFMPQDFPAALSESVSRLDGGEIQKVCFSFERLTVTNWHSPAMHVGLVTGPFQQALLTLARAENVFHKRASQLSSIAGKAP
jgi:hypothetical protein